MSSLHRGGRRKNNLNGSQEQQAELVDDDRAERNPMRVDLVFGRDLAMPAKLTDHIWTIRELLMTVVHHMPSICQGDRPFGAFPIMQLCLWQVWPD